MDLVVLTGIFILVLAAINFAASVLTGKSIHFNQGNTWVIVAYLEPVCDARTVRLRASEVLVTDGPFAETKEQIGGYDVIECADLDEAITIASRHPVARIGTIEVRPLQQRADDL
jgi:hypothetical protein